MKKLSIFIALSVLVGLGSGFSSPALAQDYYYGSSYNSPYTTYVNPYNGYYQNSYRTAPVYRDRRYVRSYPGYGNPYYYNNYGYRYNERRSGGRIAADILNQIF